MYPSFFNYINNSDIFILIETHIKEEKFERVKKYFPGFDLYCESAKRNSNYGHAIGGLLIGINKKLKNLGVRYELKKEAEINLLKIQTHNTLFTLVPLYLRPASWRTSFNMVRQIFEECSISNPLVIGDLNARIGEFNQEIVDIYNESFSSGYKIRKSKDKTINHNGRQLLQFCTDNNLLILNGRTRGDEEGALTFISSLGESVNDICAISQELLYCVEEFYIDSKTWSDHLPINLKIKLADAVPNAKELNLLPKLHWKNDQKESYQQKLNENIENLLSRNLEPSLNDLCNVIKKSTINPLPPRKTFTPKHNWYNSNCNKAREKSFEMLNKYRSSGSLDDREKYLAAQKQYKYECKTSKTNYNQQLIIKINQIKDSKEWWRVVKELRNQKYQICPNILAAEFKDYFENLLNPPQQELDICYAPMLYEDVYLDSPITRIELKNMLRKVKLNKAPGEDRIPYEFIINATENFYTQLINIYNKHFNTGNIDDSFTKTIVFPIFKKGDINLPMNYRGISFINCIVKIMMGILNERLFNWVENHNILTEYQAGFRRRYSTADNIYNLAAIVKIKLNENKKVYAFFVDFKAAFDKVSRKALIYKLYTMGVSYKFVKIIESIYNNTQTAVWTGDEMSEYFETKSGVKQGCLLSPLLFSLYINDLYECLEGGLYIDHLNIRLLLYADDIVILADNIATMQKMIKNLENYCNTWNLEVNLNKSEILIFRNGGRVSAQEKWLFRGEEVKISKEYIYLGVVLTPKMKFNKHIEKRNAQAKNAINTTWQNFLGKTDVSLRMKWKVYLAVCRAIQSYAAQVWGFGNFEEVDILQRYFMKKILKIPNFTPNYALMLETSAEDSHLYTLGLHLNYIQRVLFQYGENRLPNQLTKILWRRELFWVQELKTKTVAMNLQWPATLPSKLQWERFSLELTNTMKEMTLNQRIQRKLTSDTRIYRDLDFTKGQSYFTDDFKLDKITWIFKARTGLISLNFNRFGAVDEDKFCKICNLREYETLQHFLGICPAFREFRNNIFRKSTLSDEEIIDILDGQEEHSWENLIKYLKCTLKYRQFLINEFN